MGDINYRDKTDDNREVVMGGAHGTAAHAAVLPSAAPSHAESSTFSSHASHITHDDLSLPVLQTSGLRWLGIGVSGIVYALDERTVAKIAPTYNNKYATNESLQDLFTERSVYQRLGSHPRICQHISSVQRGILLERFGESLRKHLQKLHEHGKTPSHNQALKWSCQVAEGIAYLHQKSIVQGDIGCHNILLKGDEVKICDFGGASIDGRPATAGYECRSQRCDGSCENPSIKSELFALGSTMYEIWTASRPYQNEPDDIVEENYKCRCFPDVGTLPVADIIEKCWHGTYNSADEVVADLTLLQTELAALLPGRSLRME
ncbi:kinase-like protein [Trematosphaeria pertusa]|uniref:Kinase-like protein n=1 Tax=Trematosphaeria pertusa TaxID=390896 RepID=A0A6A6I3Y7_9PLEO|nr:kinase-like protein [Trematosphaeria pertusa]KAF2245204.1 kinase-like protein [Trematosphaeria pertusa]